MAYSADSFLSAIFHSDLCGFDLSSLTHTPYLRVTQRIYSLSMNFTFILSIYHPQKM